MHEDKLTPDQRIRLEAVAQANLCRQTTAGLQRSGPYTQGSGHQDPVSSLLADADRIATYIEAGR